MNNLRVYRAVGLILTCGALLGASASVASSNEVPPEGRTIAYVLTHRDWGVYQTESAAEECPNGQAQWGPREQFKALYVEDQKKRTLEESQLKQESAIWFPTLEPDPFPYFRASGKMAYGMDLDGKEGAEDFTDPDGVKGVDNQLYRAIGCNDIFRGPTGIVYDISNQWMHTRNYNRVVIELTGVDSLIDDDRVVVNVFRGRDNLVMDGTGKKVIPGGTQRVDTRWGKRFVHRLSGKIVDGVLLTEPADLVLPYEVLVPQEESYLGARLRLKLSAEKADGILAGYVNVDDWYQWLNKGWATVFQSYGRMASQSLYKNLRALADGYPDPTTGENSAISMAAQLEFTRVFVKRPEQPAEVSRLTLDGNR